MKNIVHRLLFANRRGVWFVFALIMMANGGMTQARDTGRLSDRALFEKKLEFARNRAHGDNDELFADSTLTGTSLPMHSKSETIGFGTLVVRIAGYLALVAVLILGIAWFLRKSGARGRSPAGGAIDIVENISIGQGRNVTLVRIQDTILVVGHTPHTVALLDRIEGQKAVELIAATKGGTSVEQFKDVFSTFVGKMKKSS